MSVSSRQDPSLRAAGGCLQLLPAVCNRLDTKVPDVNHCRNARNRSCVVDMKHRRLQTYADLGLDVVEISNYEWRVSLANGDEADPRCLLGFVQQVDGLFEVTEICRPGKRTYHRRFESALEQLRAAPPLNQVLEDTHGLTLS